jgi:hypothetical protein
MKRYMIVFADGTTEMFTVLSMRDFAYNINEFVKVRGLPLSIIALAR